MDAVALPTSGLYQVLDRSLTIETNISLLCIEPGRHVTTAEALGRVLLVLAEAEKCVLLISHGSISGNFCLVIRGKLVDHEIVCLQEALPFVRLSINTKVALVAVPCSFDLLERLARKAINVLACVQNSEWLSVVLCQDKVTLVEA